MRRVIVFGTFDPLHDGHRDFFRQAKLLGDELLVIVARDSSIRFVKKREPHLGERSRQELVAGEMIVDQAELGDEWPTDDPYSLLTEIDFAVIALGYDQNPTNEVVRAELKARNKLDVLVVRLRPYWEKKMKSTKLRY